MLAIEVTLLAGRYGATRYNARDEAEWPPHPGRLFSAMVSTWADSDAPDPDERASLEWLENLPSPLIACSDDDEIVRRAPVTAYVPGNDPNALGSPALRARRAADLDAATGSWTAEPTPRRRTTLHRALTAYRAAVAAAAAPSASAPMSEIEVLPEHRNRQPRQYPTVRPDDPRIVFIWPDAPTVEGRWTSLDELLSRVARLGHSATPVSCRILAEPVPKATLVPRSGGGRFLRVPKHGLLDRLEREFERHQGSKERRMPAALMEYGSARQQNPPPPAGILAGAWVVLTIAAHDDGRRPAIGLPRALELTRAVRDALVVAHPPAEEFLTGRFADGNARSHLAVVALADVGHRWADGLIRAVSLVLPRDVTEVDRAAVLRAAGVWQQRGLVVKLPPWTVDLDPAQLVPAESGTSSAVWGDVPRAVRRGTWSRPSRRWVSVTPIALDRQVRGLGKPDSAGERADERAADLIAQACRHGGLPAPIDVRVSRVPLMSGLPAASGHDRRRAFPPFVAGTSGTVRQSVHAAITFGDDVAGPVLLGAGRYLGYGLCLPFADPEMGE